MTRQTKVRLCLALFILAATLGLTVLPDQNAVAAPCCSSCDDRQANCEAGIIYTWCGGDPACCEQEVINRCWNWCIDC
jgi:hypothetical protein